MFCYYSSPKQTKTIALSFLILHPILSILYPWITKGFSVLNMHRGIHLNLLKGSEWPLKSKKKQNQWSHHLSSHLDFAAMHPGVISPLSIFLHLTL